MRIEMTEQKWLWAHNGAHNGPIHDISWSPICPYWFASGGDDAVIKVWDMRNTKTAMMELPGHTSTVKSIAWSNSHSDILSSGGLDRKVMLWNLRVPPRYAIGSISEGLDGVVSGVAFSATSPLQVFGLAETGEHGNVVNVTMTPDFLKPMVPHRFRSKDGEDVEDDTSSILGDEELEGENAEFLIYTRNFRKGCEEIRRIADEYQMYDEKLRIAAQLVTLSEVVPPTEENGTLCDDGEPWAEGHRVSDDEIKAAFTKTLQQTSLFVQGVGPCPVPEIPKQLAVDIQGLELSIKMLTLLDDGDYPQFMLMKDKLMEKVRQDVFAIKPIVLRRVLSEYAENDGAAALGMALELCDAYEEQGVFDEFALFVDMLVHPTIFEVPYMGCKPTKESMARMKAAYYSYERVSKEIEIMKDMQEILKGPEPWLHIIDLVQTKLAEERSPGTFITHKLPEGDQLQIIGIPVIQTYLQALRFPKEGDNSSAGRSIDAFIVEASLISSNIIEDCPFGQTLADEVEKAFVVLIQYLRNVGSQVINIDACVDAITKVCNILEHCPPEMISHNFITEAPELMKKIEESVRGALGDVNVEAGGGPVDEAADDAKDIYIAIQRLCHMDVEKERFLTKMNKALWKVIGPAQDEEDAGSLVEYIIEFINSIGGELPNTTPHIHRVQSSMN